MVLLLDEFFSIDLLVFQKYYFELLYYAIVVFYLELLALNLFSELFEENWVFRGK